ncbi:phospholipase A1 member A-like [Anticarsia gemmatalis]|uniref:phospholipase A1 member A-like n=1 Tax=Anticarsia gemmatalis TaxID=129554 RepID=UPI003F76AE9E
MFKLAIILALALASHGFSVPSKDARNQDLCAFYLYTKVSPNTLTPVLADSTKMGALIKDANTIILIHGHEGTAFTSLNPDVKNAIIKNIDGDVNVISVDWTSFSSGSYSNALRGVPLVAASIANFITEMNKLDSNDNNIVSYDKVHVVGFGLGAHIAGQVGRSIADGKIARITGLDPVANSWGQNSARLRITDANYVEVIHTDGSGLLANGLGVPLGHVDFFANGGSNQPGCLTHACCHNRAYELFAASFENDKLVGHPCASQLQLNLNRCNGPTLRMGTNDAKIGFGIYRINTRRNYPF